MVDDPADPQALRDCAVALHLPCGFRYLSLVRDAALEVSGEMGFDDFTAGQVEMAVDEACTNAIEHSYGGECQPEEEEKHPGLLIRFFRLCDGVVVEITDYGQGFDYQTDRIIHPEDYLSNRNERGLGLYIISQFVDQVHYDRGGASGNTMRLTKRL